MKNDNITTTLHNSAKESATLVQKLFAVAQPSAVYSEPVTFDKHAHSIITASEVLVGMGFGHGMGGANRRDSKKDDVAENVENGNGKERSGGGGGGYSSARPVAVITIGPDGVHVEPIVDPSKMAIALFTTMASMFMVWAKIYKASHR